MKTKSADTHVYVETFSLAPDVREHITGRLIAELRAYFGESLSKFGRRLGRAVDPSGKTKYSRQYISALEHDKAGYRITEKIEGAIWSMKERAYGVPEGIGGAETVSILAAPGTVKPGSLVLASSQPCKYHACRVWFVPRVPWQVYHARDCARAARRERARPG